MCYRPTDVTEILRKVPCENCGGMVIPGIKCKACGHVMEREIAPEVSAPTPPQPSQKTPSPERKEAPKPPQIPKPKLPDQ